MTLAVGGGDRGAPPAFRSDHVGNHTESWGGWEGIVSMLGQNSFSDGFDCPDLAKVR
jgi:hypothetical protein